MSDPDNHTLRLLKKLREDVAGIHTRFDTLEAKLDQRFKLLDMRTDSVKQAAFGESILGRYAVASVEERLIKLEEIMALRRS